MYVVVTYKQNIKTKDGREFVIYRGINDNGDSVEAFLTGERAREYAIPDSAIATKGQLKQLFESFPVIEVEYNQRGRIESMKA